MGKDDVLSPEELAKLVNPTLSREGMHVDLEDFFAFHDTNSDGKLSTSEYVDALASQDQDREEHEKEFRDFDKDGDGFATLEEMKKTVDGHVLSKSLLESVITIADDNKDGEVTLAEMQAHQAELEDHEGKGFVEYLAGAHDHEAEL